MPSKSRMQRLRARAREAEQKLHAERARRKEAEKYTAECKAEHVDVEELLRYIAQCRLEGRQPSRYELMRMIKGDKPHQVYPATIMDIMMEPFVRMIKGDKPHQVYLAGSIRDIMMEPAAGVMSDTIAGFISLKGK